MTGEKIKEVSEPIVIRGIGVGRGIAIGPIRFDPLAAEGERRGVAEELAVLDGARDGARREILALRDMAVKSVGEEHGEVYDLHLSMLDGELTEIIKGYIEKGDKLTGAIEKARERLESISEKESDRPKRAMAAHAREVLELMLAAADEMAAMPKIISATNEKTRAGEKYILVTSGGDGDFVFGPCGGDVVGLLCVGGTENSGLAAYARAKGIPALVISEADAPELKYEGSGAIIDPERNRLTINPDLAALDRFTESSKRAEETDVRLAALIGKPSVTRSGRYMSVLATVEKGDGAAALSADAEGVGVLKTEHLFEKEDKRSVEESNFAEYVKVLGLFKERPVTVRLFAGGRGGDTGQRGVRYCLARRDLLKGQIRALLRGAAVGEISAAVPMAVSPEEIRRVRAVITEAASELKSEGVAWGELRLGAVIDTPAAAINGDLMAAECDFFIADTDSLSALTLGADRTDPAVAEIIRKNPGPVLRLIGYAAKTLHASGKGKLMGVAGDLAADTSITERLLALGVDFLSVSPPYVLEVRERIRESP